MSDIQNQIEELWKSREGLSPDDSEANQVIHQAIDLLDQGKARVAEPSQDGVIVNEWLKLAILLLFKQAQMSTIEAAPFEFADKIPLKENYQQNGVRVVPGALARWGSYLAPGVIMMPSFVNIGAWVGENTMVDTWATVGSCAQIGKNVHLSGGVGIGGVLEPAGAKPVIIGDGAFIGSRAIIVEGVEIGKEAVVAANVTITASTPIIDIRGKEKKEYKGFVPERAVVVPGTKEKEVEAGKIYTSCAYVIGERKESTDKKTSLNDVLREFSLSV